MKKEKFIKELCEVLEIDEEISEEANFRELKGYDSLSVMTIVAFLDEKFGINLSSDDLVRVSTARGLIKLIGEEKFD